MSPQISFTNGLLTGANTAGSIFLEVWGDDRPKEPAPGNKKKLEESAVEQEETVKKQLKLLKEPAKEVEDKHG